MKVKEWVDFLQKDEQTKKIGLEMKGGFPCRTSSYVAKEEFANSLFADWMDAEVVKIWYENLPSYTLLIFEC